MTSKPKVSKKAQEFSESVIREMSRLAARHGAVNLAQGFPDFPAPSAIKQAARQAIDDDVNQYAITWGAKAFRDALAVKHQRFVGIALDPEREITVTCGSTEAMLSTLLATIDPGDEVIVFEPWYENYGPDVVLSGATPRYVALHAPAWSFEPAELRAAFSPRTKAIIVNTPHNPTGKVFTRSELELVAELATEFDALVITDEIYEHIVYPGHEHVYPQSLPGMRERTVMISGLSKTFSVTGWRLGYAIAPPEITDAIRKVHDFCTVGAPAPLQAGGVTALEMGDEYYAALSRAYLERRDSLLPALQQVGFKFQMPQGAYYVLSEYPDLSLADDVAFTRHLIEQVGVAVVPGSSFYRKGRPEGRRLVRFCFPKRLDTLREAVKRLGGLGRLGA